MMSNLPDYRKISVSLIATVFNEQDHILELLESYKQQTLLAKEFIIVDSLSTDGTDRIIEQFAKNNSHLNIKLYSKKSKRSVARNFAVSKASSKYLAFTDAGCSLDKFWLEELVKELTKSKARIVGGFFAGLAKTSLQEAIVPYFLQLNRRVNQDNFVPTTRSLLMEKKLWLELGGLNEKLDLSEDYQLMLEVKKRKIEIAFAKQAIVYWYPPKNFFLFLKKITSFAKSDIEAGIIRWKVISIFLRYLFFLFLIWQFNFLTFISFFFLYLLWSIYKNYHNCPTAWYFLPILQFSSDLAIIYSSLLAIPNFKSKAV